MAQTKKASSRGTSSSNGSSKSKSSKPKSTKSKSSKSSKSKATKPKAPKSKAKSNGTSGSKQKAKGATAKAKSTAAGAGSNGASNGHGSTQAVKDAVMSGVHGAADVARKAKTPLIASGAAVAGVAGAVVLSQSGGKKKKVLGVPVPKRSKLNAAKRHVPKVHMPKSK